MQDLENILDILKMKRRRLEKNIALDLARIENMTAQLSRKLEKINDMQDKLFSTDTAYPNSLDSSNFDNWKTLQKSHCAQLQEEKKSLAVQLSQKREKMKVFFIQEDTIKARIALLNLELRQKQEDIEASKQLENWIFVN